MGSGVNSEISLWDVALNFSPTGNITADKRLRKPCRPLRPNLLRKLLLFAHVRN